VCCIGTLEHIGMSDLPGIARDFTRITRKWVHIAVPVVLTPENRPWGDPTHVTYMPVSYWVSLFYDAGLLVDFRRSAYQRGSIDITDEVCHNVELALCKGELPDG